MGRVNLEQSSSEWLRWRKEGVGGSDISCVTGSNQWRSKYNLWREKTGRESGPEFNAAMRRGVELEPHAREAFYEKTNIYMVPACWEHDRYPEIRSSLDGIDLSRENIQEIKCPSSWQVHKKHLDGIIAPYYLEQCQYNMGVSGAGLCYFISYFPEAKFEVDRLAIIKIERNDEIIKMLFDEAISFWELVHLDLEPEVTESEHVHIEDPEALTKAEIFAQKNAVYLQAKAEMEAAKADLLDCTDDGNCIIGSVKITRVVRKGAIDYGKAFKAMNLDAEEFEQFRKTESTYWKLTEVKE